MASVHAGGGGSGFVLNASGVAVFPDAIVHGSHGGEEGMAERMSGMIERLCTK